MKKSPILTLTKAFLILIISGISLDSCTEVKSTSINQNYGSRIKLKEAANLNGYRYSIIEVDSIEYLTQDNGGFIRISK